METPGKSAVNIVQELIAVHTTRKEAYTRMREKTDDEQFIQRLNKSIEQSDRATEALLNELSEFGDGVPGAVDMDIEFKNIWNNSLEEFDAMATPELVRMYYNLEESLRRTYRQYIDYGVELTNSLKDLLEKQSKILP